MLITSNDSRTARVRTDSQPTSFEANEQFKIFYRIVDVSTSDQIVMRFDTVNALNIMVRKINLWEGGREYLVYANDGTHSVSGTFTALPVYAVNNNLADSGLATHPVSGVTADVAIGSNIFQQGSEPTNGYGVLTATANNRVNNQPLADSNQSGVAAGLSFYLVFNNISQSDDSNGQFYLQWEERFS